MHEGNATPETPCFNSLAEIMLHFDKVPFEQFSNDLNHWFETSCLEKAKDDAAFRELGGADFPEQLRPLVERLFRDAEKADIG